MPLTDPPNPKIWSTSQISLFTLIYIENIANIGKNPIRYQLISERLNVKQHGFKKSLSFFMTKVVLSYLPNSTQPGGV